MRNLRKRIKGWSANIDADRKMNKKKILRELDDLDKKAESNQCSREEVERKRELRERMDQIWKIEEIKARQRS